MSKRSRVCLQAVVMACIVAATTTLVYGADIEEVAAPSHEKVVGQATGPGAGSAKIVEKYHEVIVGKAAAPVAESLPPVEDGHEVVVGKAFGTLTSAPPVETDAEVIVGRRQNYTSLSTRPATVILKVDPGQIDRIIEDQVINLLKNIDAVQRVEWDGRNKAVVLSVNTSITSAEDAGETARDMINRELGVTVIEVRVRR